MKGSLVVGGIAFSLLLAAGPVRAQAVEAGVVIRSGPVAGHVVVARRPAYPVPSRRVVVVERYAPRVVLVEPDHIRRGRADGWWRRRGYRAIVVYYDGRHYYDRWFSGRTLYRVEVFERGGRFYRCDG